MIEAIPVTPDSIVLIITKVEDPEELDTRFSKFSPSGEEDARENASPFTGADDILDIFQKLVDSKLKVQGSAKKDEEKEKAAETPAVNLLQLFRFSSLDGAIRAARGLTLPYDGENSLYKDPRDNSYCLALHQSGCSPEEFNRICNVLSEYGQGKTCTAAREAYLKEHGELLIKNSALHLLAQCKIFSPILRKTNAVHPKNRGDANPSKICIPSVFISLFLQDQAASFISQA